MPSKSVDSFGQHKIIVQRNCNKKNCEYVVNTYFQEEKTKKFKRIDNRTKLFN